MPFGPAAWKLIARAFWSAESLSPLVFCESTN
jgi:hypothetical protein